MVNDQADIALIDLDGTLADYDKAMYKSLLAIHSEYEPPLDVEHMHDLPPAYDARRDLIKRVPGWWLDLEQFKLGFDVLDEVHALGFELHILTKGPRRVSQGWKEKVEWCNENIQYEVQIAIVSMKEYTYGKLLVDDFPPYCNAWLHRRPRGYVIAPAHSYNTLDKFDESVRARVLRYDGTNLEEVRALLKQIKDRKPGEAL